MSKVFISMAMSLDGYISKKNQTKEHPFGVGGEQVYGWQFAKKTDADEAIVMGLMARTGAVLMGARTYHMAINDAWGGKNPFSAPVFVLSQSVPDDDVVEGFTFVTDGVETALSQARATAGDKDIWVMGGANVAQQYLKAGLVDELYLHVSPVLFGDGIRLWDNIGERDVQLEHISCTQTPGATHLAYKINN